MKSFVHNTKSLIKHLGRSGKSLGQAGLCVSIILLVLGAVFSLVAGIGAGVGALLAWAINTGFGTAIPVKGAALVGAVFILVRPVLFGVAQARKER